jgi:hypothetical protein
LAMWAQRADFAWEMPYSWRMPFVFLSYVHTPIFR